MKDAIIFLHGTYRTADLPFYKKLCRAKLKVAADGGYAFFRKAGLTPDILIGDFDSLRRIPRNLPRRTKVLSFPERKNKTDSHLALDYCLDRGLRNIDIVSPNTTEIDHFLGNVMLLSHAHEAKTRAGRVRLINRRYEIELIENDSRTFTNGVGDTVSVLPLSKTIRLTCRGTNYDVTDTGIGLGHSMGLRNRLARKRAVITVAGRALLIHRFR